MIGRESLQLRKCSVARWSAMAAQLVTLALLVAGCASGDPSAERSAAPTESVGTAKQALTGVDGVLNVATGSATVNQYTTLAVNAARGAGQITVGNASVLDPGGDPLAQGDLLMIVQMQGATIDTSDATSPTWGQVTDLGSAGNFELVEVAGVQGNVVSLLCGLKSSYVTTGAVQVIRVPQYTNVNVSALAQITAPAWNGTTGGVVAIRASGTISLGGTITASGLGFRGGVADNASEGVTTDVTTYASAINTQGGGKGEGIAGLLTLYGRGAPANGGGGGNSHNAGGGGGANARTLAQAAWTGQGVMKNVTGASGGPTDAWRLDPAYVANGNARTASAGGGRGGYTYSEANLNATTAAGAPELATWMGNSRRERGGLGGRPLDNSPTGRLFLGGGGGSGDSNNNNQGLGGRGGGIVFLMADVVNGGGSVVASGADGDDSDSTDAGAANGDAPGGGGGGGTIVIQSASLANLTVRADGGEGGTQLIDNGNEAEGPAGGGGGGYLALPATQTAVVKSVAGAIGGVTTSAALAEFPSNGATAGNDGDPNGSSTSVSLCTTGPATTITTAEPNPTNDPTGDFVFSGTPAGGSFECSVDGAAYSPCSATFSTAALADGSHTIDVRAVDTLGFRDPSPATYTWTVDTGAPETTIDTAEPDPTADPTAEFVFESSDAAATFECSIDSGTYAACDAAFSTAPLADGPHTISVRARDTAGNVDATPAIYTWTVDATAPDTTIDTKEPNPTNDATGDFGFTSDDATATFECSVDGGTYATCPATFSTGVLADGPHTIAVRARDALGNVDASPASYGWTVDTIAPDTTIATKEASPTNDPTGDFGFASDESPVGFECSVDAAAFVVCAAAFSTAALADGPHSIAVRAIDAAGNLDATPATYEWTIDATPPETTIDPAEPSPTNDPTGDFGFHSNDATATFECSLDSGAFEACAATFSTGALSDGPHTLAVRARDPLGNVDTSPATHAWVVDTDPPETTIPIVEPSPTGDTIGDFGFASDEADSTFECSVDAAAFAPCLATFSTPALAAGPHTIQVRATDKAGNVDQTPAIYDWTISASVLDTDGDGLSDTEEDTLGTDKNDADSDDDGVIDGEEPHPGDDPDHDGLINALDPDSDDDGLFDGTELGVTAPDPDTDLTKHNFVADADDSTQTDPEDPDTDGGTVEDGAEDPNHDGKIDAGERDPLDAADDVGAAPLDTDGDGLTDAEEDALGTDKNDADSDDDGVEDGAEPNPSADSDGDGRINPLDPDSDDDGLFDGTELGLGCSGAATDPAARHCRADADPATKTSPLDPDSDNGGVRDGSEDTSLDGKLDAGETDPTLGHGADDGDNLDADGDGLSDGLEETIGSDPNDADSDDDGLLDGEEPNPTLDSDGDGLKNPLDPDSDNDGLLDGTEAGKDCSNAATSAVSGNCVADADPTTVTSLLNPDTDDGGVSDGDEDTNHDGAVDAGERDPLDASDDGDGDGEGGAGGMAAGTGGMAAGTGGTAGSDSTGGTGGTGGVTGTSGSGGVAGTAGDTGAGGDDGSAGTSNGGTTSGGTAAGGTTGAGGSNDKHPVVLGGGICSVSAPGSDGSRAIGLLAAAAVAAVAARRRRRPGR
jgi:MYXO-CTERM domain-containing protein